MLAMVFLSGSLGRSGSLRLNLTRRRFAHTTHWLIAAATHRQLGMSYEEASDALQHVDASMLDEFAAELAKGGQQVVASTAQVTVLDSAVAEETSGPSRPTRSWLRSLHFNDRLDYVQSCVRVKGAAKFRAADHSQPPPAHGATATHLHLLLVAVGLHRAIVSHTGRPLAEDLRIAVLGAGGCSVPAYLATALRLPGGRRAEIDAVELNKDVVPLRALTLASKTWKRPTISYQTDCEFTHSVHWRGLKPHQRVSMCSLWIWKAGILLAIATSGHVRCTHHHSLPRIWIFCATWRGWLGATFGRGLLRSIASQLQRD